MFPSVDCVEVVQHAKLLDEILQKLSCISDVMGERHSSSMKSNSKQATENKELKAEQHSESHEPNFTQAKQKRSAELKRVQAASNGKDNDKQGQEKRYYETTKITRGLTKLKGVLITLKVL